MLWKNTDSNVRLLWLGCGCNFLKGGQGKPHLERDI